MELDKQQILHIKDLALILGCSEKAIRIRQSRGQEGTTLPKSIKLGGRRVWLRDSVYSYLKSLEKGL